MVGRQDSWTQDYTEVVEFEVPLLASPPTPSPSLPSMSFAQAQGQARAQVPQSMSQPTRLSPPAAAVGGHHHIPPQPHDQSTTHHNDDNAHHNGSNPAPFARAANHPSFKSLPSSPLNPASPPHQHHQNHGMPSPSVPAGPTGGNHLPTPFGSNAPRPGSRGSQTFPSPPSVPNFSRMANEELRALSAGSTAGPYPSNLTSQGLTGGSRGSMILYRRADSFVGTPILAGEDGGQLHFLPPPPVMGGGGFGGGGGSNRGSMYSVSGDSIVSMATGGGGLGDSKYPPSLFSGGASTPGGVLSPPAPGHRGTMYDNRASYFTDNRTSMALSTFGGAGGLVAYAYDPDEDDDSDDDEDDWLHDPEVAYPGASTKKKSTNRKSTASSKANSDAPIAGEAGGVTPSASSNGGHSSTTTNSDLKAKQAGVAVPTGQLRQPDPSKIPPNFRGLSSWSLRGLINIATLVGVITALLCLFAVYPIVRMGMDEGVAKRITGNTRINATGQAVEDGFDGDGADTTPTTTGTRARPTATDLNPQGGTTFDRRELPVARAEPLPSFPAPTYAPSYQVPILEEHDSVETQGIVRMERICVPANHGVEVEVGYSVGKEKGKAFWFNGEWRLHHQYRGDQLDHKSRPTMMLLGEKKPFVNTKGYQDVTVSLVVGLPLEEEHARVRYVKFHPRPLSNSRVMGGRLKYKYGSKAKLDLCDLGKTTKVDLELEMEDVVARIEKGDEWS